jgi:hypothetical protein
MTFFSGRANYPGYLSLHWAFAMLLLPASANALPVTSEEFQEPAGLVWFVSSVEQVVDGVPTIDSGEVQTLRRGSKVAVIRYRNSEFTPLGVLEVRFTNPTWSEMEQPKTFSVEVGDLILFVEKPGDLGSGDEIRDSFIRHRIVTNANRNRYSTMRDLVEADSLQRLSDEQLSWTKGNRTIAGIVRSPSVTSDMIKRLKPFLNQILAFQDYENQGVDVARVTSLPWKAILSELRRNSELTPETTEEAETPAGAITTEYHVNADNSLSVRRQVDAFMFQRSDEERNVVATICVKLLQTKTSNERQWLSQQLAKTQFPALSDEEQMLLDMETVMRRVRKTE